MTAFAVCCRIDHIVCLYHEHHDWRFRNSWSISSRSEQVDPGEPALGEELFMCPGIYATGWMANFTATFLLSSCSIARTSLGLATAILHPGR